MRTAKILTVLSAAVFALSACGGDDTGAADQKEQDTGTTRQQEDEGLPSGEDLKKDVEIVKCESGAGVGVNATIEVTNSLDEPMEYYGTLNFLDPAGKQLAEGLFNTGTLQPGASSTEEIPAANLYEVVEGATCEVVEVKLDEPV